MGFWFTLFLFVVSFVLSALLTPKPQIEDAKPAGLGDFNFPTATEGRAIPLIWGTVKMQGQNVVWYGDFFEDPIEEEVKTGMFSSKDIVVGYKYFMGVQTALCRGPIDNIRKVWVGDVEVASGVFEHDDTIEVNKPELFGGDGPAGGGGFVATWRVYEGNETQTANSYLSNHQKEPPTTGDTPAYRGTCYTTSDVGANNPGGRIYLGNSTSIKPWKWEVRRIPNALGNGSVNSGNDANPAEVIYEIMTNTEWGLGFATSSIDTTSFNNAATTLSTEGNGFSMVLDRPQEVLEMLRLIEQQIDGVIRFNGATQKWEIKLARNDYDIDTVPQLTGSNIVEVQDFARTSWEDTTNEVRVKFVNRTTDYNDGWGFAQDMANQRVQQGVTVMATETYPGVKDAALANQIAWRDLRTLSYPLAKATVRVDRTFHDVLPGDVVAFTDTDLGLTKLPMRITQVDYGTLLDGKVTLELVQDVFQFRVGAFGDPPDSGWDPPSDDLQPFPTDEQLAFEAPRAFADRDPKGIGPDRFWAAGQRQGNERSFSLRERHASGTPSGDFTKVGEVFRFMKLGTLVSNLDAGTAIPTATIAINPFSGLTQAEIEAAFVDDPGIGDQGRNLLNLILIDDEFMSVTSAANGTGSQVDLTDTYRGMLDTVQADHTAATEVYLVFLGGGLSDVSIDPGQNVHVKLTPKSRSDEVADGDATQIAFTMDDRYRRPYPPSFLTLGGTRFATTIGLESTGSDAEDYAIDLGINRRSWRTANGLNEIQALETDAALLFTDFPARHSTDQQVDVRDDPDGTNTFLFTDTYTAATQDVLRIKILKETDGVVPTRLRFVLRTRHTVDGTVYGSRQEQTWDFDVTTDLTGNFNFGALDTDDTSNTYTADAAGQHDFVLSSSFTAGDVEYRIDTGGGFGSWLTLISAGGTTGNIPGVAVSDDIQIRHRSSDSGALKQIDMTAPGAGTDAHGIFFV